jgi:hypothetical protein
MATELPIACSLNGADASTRQKRWLAIAESALLEARRVENGARQIYRADPAVEQELAQLIRLEAECCAFLDFRLTRGSDRLTLDVSGPPEAGEIVDLFAAVPRP